MNRLLQSTFARSVALAATVVLALVPCADVFSEEEGRRAPGIDVERIIEILRDIPDPAEVLRIARERVAAEEEAAADAASKRPRAEREPRVHLRNGNVLRGRLRSGAIPVETPYGLLEFPTEKLIEIHFCLRIDPAVQARIDDALKRLGADDFEAREAATTELRTIGIDAIPALRVALRSGDEEVRRRAERLLGTLEQMAENSGDSVPLVDGRDRITTADFSFEAVVTAPEFVVTTPYGELAVPRGEVVRIHFRDAGPQRVQIVVPATASIPGGWVRTGVDLRRGQKVILGASGQMRVPDYGYVSGPRGGGRSSRTHAGMSELALVGKIGERGETFLVGEKYDAKAARSGTLYLGIVPFRYTYYRTEGSYEVTVEAR